MNAVRTHRPTAGPTLPAARPRPAGPALSGTADTGLKAQRLSELRDQKPTTPAGQNPTLASQAERARAGLGQAFELKKPVTLKNGVTVVKSADLSDGSGLYDLNVGGHKVGVRFDQGIDAGTKLPQLADYLEQTPEHLRKELGFINFQNGANPKDAEIAKKFGVEEFQTWATADDHAINVYHGGKFFGQREFDHELGHLVGARRSGHDELVDWVNLRHDPHNTPVGWGARKAYDHKEVSDYGKLSLGEDFAEGYADYMQARRQGPEAWQAFGQKFPSRTALLERIVTNGDTR
ncbi:MAG: hypothetical protein AB7S38_27200 [Vulcanimicrobiota bacterium]